MTTETTTETTKEPELFRVRDADWGRLFGEALSYNEATTLKRRVAGARISVTVLIEPVDTEIPPEREAAAHAAYQALGNGFRVVDKAGQVFGDNLSFVQALDLKEHVATSRKSSTAKMEPMPPGATPKILAHLADQTRKVLATLTPREEEVLRMRAPETTTVVFGGPNPFNPPNEKPKTPAPIAPDPQLAALQAGALTAAGKAASEAQARADKKAKEKDAVGEISRMAASVAAETAGLAADLGDVESDLAEADIDDLLDGHGDIPTGEEAARIKAKQTKELDAVMPVVGEVVVFFPSENTRTSELAKVVHVHSAREINLQLGVTWEMLKIDDNKSAELVGEPTGEVLIGVTRMDVAPTAIRTWQYLQ